jgi:NADH-quinone oxidoreductase subunit N
MAVFGVMAYVAGPDDSGEELEHFERLAKDRPFLSAVLAIGVGSLAGIPPLAGFMGKLLLFVAAFQAHLYGLLGMAIIGVVISIFYYFGWIRAAFFESWSPPAPGAVPVPRSIPAAATWAGIATLAVLAIATVVLGFFQWPLTSWLLR